MASNADDKGNNKPTHKRRMSGSFTFGSNTSDDFAKLLATHFGGPDELLPPSEVSPLLTLTSDGTMLQELLQTLETGGQPSELQPGRIFSDDTINAIMGEHFRELAADVIKDIRDGKDPKDIRVPSVAANPALKQAVAAVQLRRQASSSASMSLKEAQVSMQAAVLPSMPPGNAPPPNGGGVQQQVVAPTTVLLQPQAAPTPIITVPQPTLIDPQQQQQQQQQQFVTVPGQVVQNADGSQSVVLADPSGAVQQAVAMQQQQQAVQMVHMADGSGMVQLVPVLDSRVVAFPSVAVQTAAPSAPVQQADMMLAGTQQLMFAAQQQVQALQTNSQQQQIAQQQQSLSRSTSDTAAQAAAEVAAMAAAITQQQHVPVVALQPTTSADVTMQQAVSSLPMATAAQVLPNVTLMPTTSGNLSRPPLYPQQPLQQQPAVPQLRPASAPFSIPQQIPQQHVQQIIPQQISPTNGVLASTITTGGALMPTAGSVPMVIPGTVIPDSSVISIQQQQQQPATVLGCSTELPSKPCHKRERSMRSANPFLADPATAPMDKVAKPGSNSAAKELSTSPDSALMQDYLAGIETSSGDASPLAPADNQQQPVAMVKEEEEQHQLEASAGVTNAPTTAKATGRSRRKKTEEDNDADFEVELASLRTGTNTTTGRTRQNPSRRARPQTRNAGSNGHSDQQLGTIPETGDAAFLAEYDDPQAAANDTELQELIQSTLAAWAPAGKRRGRPPGTGKNVPNVPGTAAEPTEAQILQHLLIEDRSRRSLGPDDLKKLMRKEKNRISAAISRHNTTVYTSHLEEQVKKLEREQTYYAEALDGQTAQQPPHRILLDGQVLSPPPLPTKPPIRHISM